MKDINGMNESYMSSCTNKSFERSFVHGGSSLTGRSRMHKRNNSSSSRSNHIKLFLSPNTSRTYYSNTGNSINNTFNRSFVSNLSNTSRDRDTNSVSSKTDK